MFSWMSASYTRQDAFLPVAIEGVGLAPKLAVVETLPNTHCTYANDGLVEQRWVSQALMKNGYPR